MQLEHLLIFSLLSCLPCAASGQTSVSLQGDTVKNIRVQKARPYCTKGWKNELLHGGVIRTKADDGRRTGNHYLVMEPGLSSLLRMDFVNGYTVGPELTLGYVRQNQSRIELDANVEYGFSRRAWMGEGALRYVATPAMDSWIEVFGGRRTTDFDSEPLMDKAQQSIAVGLFGWNGHKLYEASKIGVRGRWWAARDLWIKGGVWYEGRREMTNHRKTNSFGIHPEINVPVCYDMPVQYGYTTVSTSHPWRPSDDYPTISVGPVENFHVVPLFNWERNPFLHWREDHLWRADLAFEYTPKSTLVVKDDMRNEVKSTKPTMRFAFTSAWDAGSHQWGGKSVSYNAYVWNGGFRYLSFDFSIEQRLKREKHRFSYYGSVGFFPVSDNVGLADYRHFDAAHFCWQNSLKNSLTWFSLLSNYESSTGSVWNELHGEYKYQHNDLLGQYVQLHLLHAPERPHMELSYGWQLEQQMRLGLSVGFDEIYQDFTFDGVGFNLIIEVK